MGGWARSSDCVKVSASEELDMLHSLAQARMRPTLICWRLALGAPTKSAGRTASTPKSLVKQFV
jgi:hypothetical protein